MLTNASTPVFLEQRKLDGTLVMNGSNPLALPTVASGNNQPITLSGTATSEGSLSLSANSAYLVLAGYGTTVGIAGVASTTSATVNRVVGRIDANGNVDTSTRIDSAFSANNVRGATSSDGVSFWVSGNGSAATGGVQYTTLGALGSTQVLSAPSNTRCTHVFAGQLYGTSGSGAFVNVFAIGSGLPTMSGQVATSLPGLPVSGASPYSFALLDRDPNIAGVDTLYLSDDQTQALGGGVQKWTWNGATWTKVATYTQGIATGVRGLAAVVTGNDVTVIAATTESTQNNVVVFVDDGNPSPTGTIVATAGANTVFRGVAISPQ